MCETGNSQQKLTLINPHLRTKTASFQNHSDTENGKEDNITHTHYTAHWQNTLPIFCTCSPHIYRGLKVGYDNMRHSILLKTTSRKCWKVHNGWKEQTNIITNTWTQRTNNSNHCLLWLFKECTCCLLILYKCGMIRGIQHKITDMHQKSSSWGVFETLYNKTDSFLYSDLSAV